ncbi:MAG: FIST C-terminal domain-containing protein, partial [Desulfobacula sp.]|nr:FIST C-terminal domain-containing protein [Desulfobacula sp.]
GFGSDTVVVCLIASQALSFHTVKVKGMKDNEKECGQRLAKKIIDHPSVSQAKSLILFPDGLGGDGVLLLEGMQSILGHDFEIAGGFLGDDGRFKETFQFYNGKCYRGDLVTAILISGDEQYVTSTGVASGFESIGGKIYCTKSNKNVVQEFDGIKALDFYKDLLGEERSKRLPEICLEYPFGLIDSKATIGDYEYFQLRAGLTIDEEEGSIVLGGSIPKGSAITLTTASRQGIINGAKQAAEQAKAGLKGATARLVMMFSCIGRKKVLGRRTPEEIEIVKQIFGSDIPIIGFYTYGEIGPIDKHKKELQAARLHNETVVLWVLGEIL